MKSAIVVFPGTNRERDMAEALAMASGRPPAMVWHRDTDLPEADLIVVPGGFSYGDYLRAGAMAAHSPVLRSVTAAARRGVAVLGVCNGFQILVEAGLLPGALLRNASLKFVCRDVGLRVANGRTAFAGRLSGRPDPADAGRPSRRQLFRRRRHPRPAGGRRPDRLPLWRR